MLSTGALSQTATDMALPSPGLRWVVGRTYSGVQETSGAAHQDSDGYQGKNWFQTSQPEIVFYDDDSNAGTEEEEDMVLIVYGADRFLGFRRVMDGASPTDTFRGVNGAAGVVVYTEDATSEPDTYSYFDQSANETVFFGFDADASPCEGQFWKMSDPDGYTIYVGDDTTGSTAISNGFDSGGRITTAYDAVSVQDGRRYTYTYTTLDSVERLTEVKAEVKTGGTWASPTGLSVVGKVEYAYYQTGTTTYGDIGNLKLVTVTTPLSDSGVDLVRNTHYRYWTGAFHATSNPGHANTIQYVVEAEGYRQADWSGDSDFDDDPLTFSEASLKSYASTYAEYDSSYRVNEAWFNGQCGCSGASNGVYTFEYESNGSHPGNAGYDEEWKTRTIVANPDGSYRVQYFDETAQALSSVVADGDPSGSPDFWATKIIRNDGASTQDATIDEMHMPDATSYTHATGAISTSSSVGLVYRYQRTTSGDLKGMLIAKLWGEGDTGTKYYINDTRYADPATTDYESASSYFDIVRPTITSSALYTGSSAYSGSYSPKSADGAGYEYTENDVDYPVDGGGKNTSLIATSQDNTIPNVVTAENGSNTADTNESDRTDSGLSRFSKAEDGIVTFTAIDDYGLIESRILDANTQTLDTAGVTLPSTWTATNVGLHLETAYAYDAQGRSDTLTEPSGRIRKSYYSKLADGRLVTLQIPKMTTGGSTTYYGPVSYTVNNLAGQSEVSGTIALSGGTSTSALTSFITETSSDPIGAVGVGTVESLTVRVYNESGGTMDEVRAYFDIPGSGSGTEGTNYDASFSGYDAMGRRTRVEQASGTIQRSEFDAIGRRSEQWIGTNDSTFDGGSPSGTDNMVKVSAIAYDGGGVGNGLVTSRTAYVEDSATDSRVTSFEYDVRGRLLVQENPESPHQLHKYNEAGWREATGQYSTVIASLDSQDPTTYVTARIGLEQSDYDSLGRAWKRRSHEIDPADGSNDDDIEFRTYYDAAGRVLYTTGNQSVKVKYDRLGRLTNRYLLSYARDTLGYGDADDVVDDLVLQEQQTYYEDETGNVLMTVNIDRLYDDYGGSESTAELDTDSDVSLIDASEVNGRVSITAHWYDSLDRRTDTVRFGTYGGADFDRDAGGFASPPARSDTALRSTTVFNDDGTRLSVTDAMGYETRFEYDDIGRTTKTIENYTDGTPGGGTNDDQDRTMVAQYTDGLRTLVRADLSGTDQDTTYTYGTTKGVSAGDSKIASGHLLQKATYPDSGSGSDVVTYAYNAQGQQVYLKDQSGNVVETDFDDAGREEHRRVSTLAGGFDGDVRRISFTYENRGLVETVTQYDNATAGSGSIVDEVKYAYDGWAQISRFEQDRNSAVGTGSDDYGVRYERSKAWPRVGASEMMRLDDVKYHYNSTLLKTVTLNYYDVSNAHFADAALVSDIEVDSTTVVEYEYNGVSGEVERYYTQPDVFRRNYSGSTFPNWDRFGRVTADLWTKDLTTDIDFYDVDIAWDRNSNITHIVDNVRTPFSVDYTNDDLNRLIQAERGIWGGSSITTTKTDELWTLSQTGNWELHKLDLNGNGSFTDTGELNDDATFNVFNELTSRDTDDDGTDDYTLAYDAVGNLTDDGENYDYIYDAFGRLREIQNRSTSATVAEYTYNGLGYRNGWHYDVDGDGTVEATSDDPWFYFAYDKDWRIVMTFQGADSKPKEEFVYHAPGKQGFATPDELILRDRDTTANWESSTTTATDERHYYCQNWRGDVVEIVSSNGKMAEAVRYTAYGVPFGIPLGDVNSSGVVGSAGLDNDPGKIQLWINLSQYKIRGDLDLDGDVDTADKTISTNSNGNTLGYGALSLDQHSSVGGLGNRRGYAGYEHDGVLQTIAHVRYRVYLAELGRWSRRDPLGFVDGMSVYEYVGSLAVTISDPMGMQANSLTLQDACLRQMERDDQDCLRILHDEQRWCRLYHPFSVWPHLAFKSCCGSAKQRYQFCRDQASYALASCMNGLVPLWTPIHTLPTGPIPPQYHTIPLPGGGAIFGTPTPPYC